MISLIVRAHNRLEYTTKCLGALAKQADAPRFEVVLVDAASDDGTREWIAWLKRNESARGRLSAIRYVRLEKNPGDWKGMVEGYKHCDPRATHIGQLDNDIVLPPAALVTCRRTFAAKLARVVMLRRTGVRQAIPATGSPSQQNVEGALFQLQPVPWCVAFWLTEAQHFNRVALFRHCRQFTSSIGGCQKITSLDAVHAEGWQLDGPQSNVQAWKYDRAAWIAAKAKGIVK